MKAPFRHRQASHCESGTMALLVTHAGLPMSESMAFGLASALSFAYIPIVKVSGQPLVAYRAMPHTIPKRLCRMLGLSVQVETFRSADKGAARLDEHIDAGRLVGLQTSGYWLTYFPPELRFHFNVHNSIAIAREGDDYTISDPLFEEPVHIARADLLKARFAKGLMAPKGRLYYIRKAPKPPEWTQLLPAAIRRNCRTMLAPVPFAGVKGIRLLARTISRLDASGEGAEAKLFLGHIVRMQEEIGTGGAGFRFIYAAFLQEAAELLQNPKLRELADELVAIGDEWREMALEAAMMIRGRRELEPSVVADLLRWLADREEAFFRRLKAAV
jgi:hypothetical protein